ncbi:MAG: hypothetical protein KOO62_10970 [candidate division Zixibacteria bacterium]|nr:hypothetical protein [candidate division Zixibacteria bacterium]
MRQVSSDHKSWLRNVAITVGLLILVSILILAWQYGGFRLADFTFEVIIFIGMLYYLYRFYTRKKRSNNGSSGKVDESDERASAKVAGLIRLCVETTILFWITAILVALSVVGAMSLSASLLSVGCIIALYVAWKIRTRRSKRRRKKLDEEATSDDAE